MIWPALPTSHKAGSCKEPTLFSGTFIRGTVLSSERKAREKPSAKFSKLKYSADTRFRIPSPLHTLLNPAPLNCPPATRSRSFAPLYILCSACVHTLHSSSPVLRRPIPSAFGNHARLLPNTIRGPKRAHLLCFCNNSQQPLDLSLAHPERCTAHMCPGTN